MSMLDVAKFLSYSKSVDLAPERDRYFNLSMVNSGHLFSCLYSNGTYWNFGRKETDQAEQFPPLGKGI